jgi:hypothetical protein
VRVPKCRKFTLRFKKVFCDIKSGGLISLPVTTESSHVVTCITVMRRITTIRLTTNRIYDGGKNFFENLEELIVKENYLPKQIFNTDEISLQFKWMSEMTFTHKAPNSWPCFKV